MRHGLLIINLGTPKRPDIISVGNYLREFLTDKRVINLPAFLRYLLVYFFILPFRTKRSAHAYQMIWTTEGSPLLYYSENLAKRLQEEAGSTWKIALGMRYGTPSIQSALNQLKACESITILPLYPQYSSAANGSAIEEVMRHLSSWDVIPSVHIIPEFFQHPAYIHAQASLIKAHLPNDIEHVLFSYHGIPERQITKEHCPSICTKDCPPINESNKKCYKAQCHQTSRLLAKELHLTAEQYHTSFQSRLGKTPWIQPYTDSMLSQLASHGVKKLVIVCPSFVADCLETLEEIGIRAQSFWQSLGGEQLILIPALNEHPLWTQAIFKLIQKN